MLLFVCHGGVKTSFFLSRLRAAGVLDVDVRGVSSDDEGSSSSSEEDSFARVEEAEDPVALRALALGVGRCAYLSPLQLRYDLELQLQRKGDAALDSEALQQHSPALFWSLWWYCARARRPTTVYL